MTLAEREAAFRAEALRCIASLATLRVLTPREAAAAQRRLDWYLHHAHYAGSVDLFAWPPEAHG